MKIKFRIFLLSLFLLSISSCVQKEAKNKQEAKMNLKNWLTKNVGDFLQEMNLDIDNSQKHIDRQGMLKGLSFIKEGDKNTRIAIFLEYAGNLIEHKERNDVVLASRIEGVMIEENGKIINNAGQLQMYLIDDLPTMDYDKLIIECKKLKKGMSKKKVEDILGKPHEILWSEQWVYHHNKSFLQEGKGVGSKSYTNAIIEFENNILKMYEEPYVRIYGRQ